MTGISSLFPAFPKQMFILDRVNINVARHKNDYFKNWTSQQLDDSIVIAKYRRSHKFIEYEKRLRKDGNMLGLPTNNNQALPRVRSIQRQRSN